MRPRAASHTIALLLGISLVSCSENPIAPSGIRPGSARRDESASRPSIVISQIYGGGGNSGATLKNDFIELFNPGGVAVSVTGWSVQYASANSTTWAATTLSGTIPPGGYYLVQEAAGANAQAAALPTPDATGTIAMSATNAKVALVASTALITGACPAAVDIVGYGAGTCADTTRTLTNTTSDSRNDSGCAYTASPSADFTRVSQPLTPRNSATAVHVCPGQLPLGPLDHVTIGGPATVSLTAGTTATFIATPQDANNQTVPTATLTWSSSNSAVASVDPGTGQITGVAADPNPVTITATAVDNSITVTAGIQVTVTTPEIHFIDVSYSSTSIVPGFQAQIFLTARVSSGGTIVPATFTVEALDPAIATVLTPSPGAFIINAVAPPAIPGNKPRLKITATPVGGGTPDEFTTGGLPSSTTSITVEIPVSASPSIYAKNDEFGDPTPAGGNPNDLLITRPEYVLSYNESRGTPNWVSYELDSRQFGNENRCNCFTADPNLPADKQIFTSDYTNGGFDRGHMTRSADRTTTNMENATTFYLTNVVPQQADLNQGVWAQFENFVADSAEAGRAVYIITGPLYSATHQLTFLKNEGKVAVPDSTWKIALIGPVIDGVPFKLGDIQTWDDLAGVTVLAVNMPNIAGVRNDPWQKYLTTVDRIETSTGYNFLSLLQTSYQDAVEAGDHRPVASFSMSGTTNEGSSLKFDASASTDPDLGRDDLGRAEALTYTWHFSDGGQTSGKVVYHTFHDNGSFTATLTVADAFGWERNSMQTVVVANVTPSVTFGATTPTSILSGDAVSAAGGFTDPGDDAAWHTLIDWGNGATTPGTFNASGASITGSSIFLALGSYTVTLSVTDKDGATGSNSFSVNVAPRPVPTTIESPTINLNGNGNGNVSLTLTNGNGVDVSLVDISSIRLGSVGVARNGSGFQSEVRGGSLILNFSRLALTNAGVLTPSTTELDLTGSLTTGVQIAAAVSVVVH
ncbi:MAG TPA: DNA/RNA non-specific endonuclease [Gemmatimonadaceae bacterium]|nr:DNA/RNA non-specific endonuclease [Gemmatimonadaceae bacterium]